MKRHRIRRTLLAWSKEAPDSPASSADLRDRLDRLDTAWKELPEWEMSGDPLTRALRADSVRPVSIRPLLPRLAVALVVLILIGMAARIGFHRTGPDPSAMETVSGAHLRPDYLSSWSCNLDESRPVQGRLVHSDPPTTRLRLRRMRERIDRLKQDLDGPLPPDNGALITPNRRSYV